MHINWIEFEIKNLKCQLLLSQHLINQVGDRRLKNENNTKIETTGTAPIY